MSYAIAIVVIIFASILLPVAANASQDSVPMSWAIDVSNGKTSNVAVTFPWMGALHSRSVSHSARSFQLFPQVSFLGKTDMNDTSPRKSPLFAMGGGICLANALAVGVGFKVNEPFAHAYFMAGLSVTDIVKLAL